LSDNKARCLRVSNVSASTYTIHVYNHINVIKHNSNQKREFRFIQVTAFVLPQFTAINTDERRCNNTAPWRWTYLTADCSWPATAMVSATRATSSSFYTNTTLSTDVRRGGDATYWGATAPRRWWARGLLAGRRQLYKHTHRYIWFNMMYGWWHVCLRLGELARITSSLRSINKH